MVENNHSDPNADTPSPWRAARRRSILTVAAIALIYYAAARLGLLLQLPDTNSSPFWPPSGVAFAAVLLFGLWVWPGIALGAFLANLVTLPHTVAGVVASAMIGVGNTLEHVVGLLLLRRLVPSLNPFERSRDVIWYLLVAGLSCLVASSIGTAALWLTEIVPRQLCGQAWFTWWLGDTAGMLVLTPAIYCWGRTPRLGLPPKRAVELLALIALTAATAEFLFGGWLATEVVESLPYLVVPALLWAAFRFGPRETATIAVLIAGIAVFHTWRLQTQALNATAANSIVYAPFVSPTMTANESLLLLQLFTCAVALTAVTLAAAVTERTTATRALAESEQRFRTIFEQAAVGVAFINTVTGRFVRVNQRYCDMVGYSLDEMPRTTYRALTHADDLEEQLANMRRLLAGEIGKFTMEKRLCRKDGSVVWINLTVSPTWRPGEKPEFHIAIVEDITERKRADERLLAALQDKEVLLREIHHRVKNNLAVISSLFYLQSTYTRDEATIRLMEEGQDRVRSMALVHEILYRSENPAAVNFGEHVQSLADHLFRTYSSPDRFIQLETDLVPVMFSIEAAIPGGLILNELITNCLKHAFVSRDRGTVTIALRQEEGGLCILRVADDGVGLPLDLDVWSARSLGLRLVRSLAGQLNGTIEIRRADPGTEAILSFPLVNASRKETKT